MDFEIRQLADEDYRRLLLDVTWPAFGEEPDDEEVDKEELIQEPGRTFAAVDGGRYVGSLIGVSYELYVPGGLVPASGVTSASVLPTHRRRGILSALMRRHIEEVRERGESVSLLYASEGNIYGRFGFGLATWESRLSIERSRTDFMVPVAGGRPIDLVGGEEALRRMPAVFDEAMRQRHGAVTRPGRWWEYRFSDPEHDRGGASPFFYAMTSSDGADDGYVVYRIRSDWPQGIPTSALNVYELVTSSDEATASLWRYCFDVDLIGEITAWRRPPDEPLRHMVTEPRRLRMTESDGMWVRLVDVPTALAARSYAAEGSVVFEVHDALCEWNEGRFVLEAGPGGATCEATSEDPDLALSAAELGAMYLSGNTFAELARARRVQELTAGALSRADRMFATDLAPWNPTMF